jgi:hypothetical protein
MKTDTRIQKGKRTGVDFSEHELRITSNDDLTVHYLRKPNTICDSVKFINTQGILAVTGDYSNWIFCRSFIPGPKEFTSDGYWREKLQISSCQEPLKFDADKTEVELKRRLNDEGEPEDHKEYYRELLDHIGDGEIDYLYHALNEVPGNFDYEHIPMVRSYNYHFLVVLDAFDEICHRLKESTNETNSI